MFVCLLLFIFRAKGWLCFVICVMLYLASFLVYNHLSEEEGAGCCTLSSRCDVVVGVLCLYLTVPVFAGYTHLLFCAFSVSVAPK